MTSYVFAENPAPIIPAPSLNDTPSAIVIFASAPAVSTDKLTFTLNPVSLPCKSNIVLDNSAVDTFAVIPIPSFEAVVSILPLPISKSPLTKLWIFFDSSYFFGNSMPSALKLTAAPKPTFFLGNFQSYGATIFPFLSTPKSNPAVTTLDTFTPGIVN